MNFLFDLYGTLIDIKTDEKKASLWTAVASALNERDGEGLREEYLSICKRLAEERSCEFAEFDLLRVFEEMLEGRGMDKKSAPELARQFRLASREKLRVFPCVKDMLSGLRERGAGVYLLSNAQSCFTLEELDECGLTQFFDGILISSDAGVKKPSREIFEIAFNKFSLNAADCYYVGNDLRDDVLGAHRAGIRTVYIETEQSGKYPPETLVDPDHALKAHADLRDMLFDIAQKA